MSMSERIHVLDVDSSDPQITAKHILLRIDLVLIFAEATFSNRHLQCDDGPCFVGRLFLGRKSKL